MSEKKNIDRLFQEKFKDFEVAPNDALWNRISESLPNKKKKRRVIALWWQIGGVAAVIALLLTVGVSVFNSDEKTIKNLPVVSSDSNNKSEDNLNTSTTPEQNKLKNNNDKIKFVDADKDQESLIEKQKGNNTEKSNVSNQLSNPDEYQQKINAIAHKTYKIEKNTSTQNPSHLTNKSSKETSVKIADNTKSSTSDTKNSNDKQLATDSEIKSVIKNTVQDTKATIAEQNSSNHLETEYSTSKTKKEEIKAIQNTTPEEVKKQTIEEAIAEQTNTIIEKEEDKQNRWSIVPNVAPVYYSSLGQGSSLDRQFNENSKSSAINMSYGIAGAYAISNKIKVRAGVNRVNLSQTTSEVFAFTGAENAARGVDAQFGNISFKDGAHSVSLMSSKMLDRASVPELFNTKIAGDIDQQFSFIEVPLELEYRLLDTKFGINVIGGFSTFFLNQNEIYADIDGTSTLIGEANNINDTSFSANFGLGMDYSLSKQWNINLEPTFKYQINTFNNTSGNFRPFFVGVYTGLSFKF
jgi:hypothetical protein